ncbi:type I restriction endonuclease subunit R, EcoR124 family, partial [Propioniciclava flava]|uniref:type I restriction endonuclease subunit R, EcoR124 family n=1 Tax=Propioniciclava flava TaxID=2072026 RepID=UPI0019D67C2D
DDLLRGVTLPAVRHDLTSLPARDRGQQDDSHNDWTYETGSAQLHRQAYISTKREAELQELIEAHKLKLEETQSFVEEAFRDGQLRTAGTEITRILPPVSRFNRESNHGDKNKRVIEALSRFFERFRALASGNEASTD